jgi:hypothetical protein
MPISSRLTAAAVVLMTSLTAAHAFPQDGQFYLGFSCPSEGFTPGSEGTASLSFPTLCLFEQCCDLSNPVNIRDMSETFLYDGACTAEGNDFDARLLVGEASIDGLVVVLNNNAYTYARCEP